MYKSLAFFLLGIILLTANPAAAQQKIISKGNKKYVANQIIVKINKSAQTGRLNKSSKIRSVDESLQQRGVIDKKKLFMVRDNDLSAAAENVKEIYTLTYSANEDPEQFAANIAKLPGIEWAEPNFVREAYYTPTDTLYTKDEEMQWGLYKIQAAEAWNLSKGDPEVVIAIVDTGIFWDHPDLRENIWQNLNEDFDGDGHTIELVDGKWVLDPGDINGIDDDQNGYTDDLIGWDFLGLDGTPDNNPEEDSPSHGTHVAGTASAVSDNIYGIASIGFNCSLMAVKTSQHSIGDRSIVNGHNGIYYAAANGAKVINCSWGGTGYSMAEKAAVDYAIEKGALVVASAGNDGNDVLNYPASYEGVLSVGNTGKTDYKNFSSNYGTMVDVMAPGESIISTWSHDAFGVKSGTSMASPLVAGLAGLVFSHFNNYTPLQVLEQIRVNCDDISDVNPNRIYEIGKGRINAYKTLSNNNAVSVKAADVEFIDQGDGDGRFESGETVLVRIKFVNYLNPVGGVNVNMVTQSGYVNITNSSFNTGALNTLGEVTNTNNEFSFKINANAPFNETVDFRLDFSGSGCNDYQWLSVNLNTTYNTLTASNLVTTITSTGSIGYNDYPDNTQGNGLFFHGGNNLLWEGAFMYGTSASKVMDAARENGKDKSTDFTMVSPVAVSAGNIADEESVCIFNDDGAGQNKLGIETELHTYGFANSPDNNYIIFKYIMTNKSGADINGLYAGLFFDLDIDETNWDGDVINYDYENNFGYMYDEEGDPTTVHVGASVLRSPDYGFYAIRFDGRDMLVDISPDFKEESKWNALSNGLNHSSVTEPQDLAFVVSGGPYDIPANQNIDIAFVVAAGLTLDDLKAAIIQSRTKGDILYTGIEDDEITIPDQYALMQNYPNPFNPSTIISYQLAEPGHVLLKVYDILGKEIATLVNEDKPAGNHNVKFNISHMRRLSSGVYFYTIKAGSFFQTNKMLLVQ